MPLGQSVFIETFIQIVQDSGIVVVSVLIYQMRVLSTTPNSGTQHQNSGKKWKELLDSTQFYYF